MEARLAAALASAAKREALALKLAEEEKATALEFAVKERVAAEAALKQQLVSHGCMHGSPGARLASPVTPHCAGDGRIGAIGA